MKDRENTFANLSKKSYLFKKIRQRDASYVAFVLCLKQCVEHAALQHIVGGINKEFFYGVGV